MIIKVIPFNPEIACGKASENGANDFPIWKNYKINCSFR